LRNATEFLIATNLLTH